MKYKTTEKDRYGNMRSLEITTTDGQLQVPPMASMMPQYEAVGGLADNHPGEPKGSDTVPAWLTPGEFVVNKEAVDMYGPQIKKMNDVGREVQDGDMNPDQAPPVYADAGVAVPILKPKEFNADYISEAKAKVINKRQEDIYNYLKYNYKLKDNAIAAIMGQIGHESAGSFDPSIQYGQKDAWSSEGAKPGVSEGLFQNDLQGNIAVGTRYDEWLESKGLENNRDNRDNTKNQIDFFMEGITKAGGVPHHDGSGYWIGQGRAEELQKAFASDMSPHEIGNLITTNYLNASKPRLEQRTGSIDEMSKSIESGMFKPGFGMPPPFKYLLGKNNPGVQDDEGNWHYDTSLIGGELPTNNPSQSGSRWDSVLDFLRGSDTNDNVPEDVAVADINEVGGVPYTEMPIPELPLFKPKPHKIPLDPSNEYDFKNKGGPIYAKQGRGLGTYEEEMLKNLQHDYGNSWNPFDNTYSSGFDYGHEPMPSVNSSVPQIGGTPYDIPNEEELEKATEIYDKRKIEDIFKNSYLGAQNDSATGTDMGGGSNTFAAPELPDIDTFNDIQPGPYTGGLGADEEDRAPLILTMPEEQITVGDGREDYRPSGFVPTMAEASADMVGESLELGNIAELEAAYQDAMNTAMLSNRDDPDFDAKQAYVKIAEEKLDAAKFGNNMLNTYRDVAPQFGGDPQWIKDVAARKILADEQATIDELKSRLNDSNITEEYKKLLEEEIAKKQAALDAEAAKEATTISGDVANRLSEAVKKISDEAAKAQQAALNTDDGKKAVADNANTEDPKFKQVKGMLNFLFGDLIDSKELGRGVAIYLASRALGYDHNSTIGFVAKKYLTRVDAKNLAMDKFIKANAGKYEKESLAEYKRTGDPSVLIPIGATARPTGEEKAHYNAAGQKRMAYKFKKKNAQGDDISYYSWDKAGGSLKAIVGKGWVQDGSDVKGTDEYKENIAKGTVRAAKVLKELKDSDQFDAHSRRQSGSGAMVNDYYTSILPNNEAGAVARWAEENGFSIWEMDSGLKQAYTMAINAAKANPKVKISSLVPYLEEATIKQRLDSFKDAEGNPIPRISTAVVDGETITMEPSLLVDLNNRISNAMGGDTNRFWNEAARVWKTNDPKTGKPWLETFTPSAKQHNLPPFALFAETMLKQKIESMAKIK